MTDRISAKLVEDRVVQGAGKAAVRRLAAAVLFGLALLDGGASAQQSPPPAQPKPPVAVAPPAQKPSHEAAPRLSKFEARRIRQACRERANERAVKGGEREAFLSKCYFGRVSHRGLRRECAQLGAAKGLTDRSALREFVRECVKEKARP